MASLTMWEHKALQAGADLIEHDDGWRWKHGVLEGTPRSSSVDAARAYLRWKRTGRDELADLGQPVTERT